MLPGIELHMKCSVNCKGSQIARSCWLSVILLKSRNPNFKALTMTYIMLQQFQMLYNC